MIVSDAPDVPVKVNAEISADFTNAADRTVEKAADVVDDARDGWKSILAPLGEVLGWTKDAIAEHRYRSMAQMRDKTNRKLKERGIANPRRLPGPALLQLTEASFDDDESLAELWSGLLADALDPNKPDYSPSFGRALNEFGKAETRTFLEAAELTKQHVAKAKVAYGIAADLLPKDLSKDEMTARHVEIWDETMGESRQLFRGQLADATGLGHKNLQDSIAVLERLHVLQIGKRFAATKGGVTHIKAPAGGHPLVLTPFGLALYRRCTGDESDLGGIE